MNALDITKKIEKRKALEMVIVSGYITLPDKIDKVIIGLDNSDTHNYLLEILNVELESIIEGIEILKYIIGTKNMILSLPEGYALREEVGCKLQEAGITISHEPFMPCGLENSIFCHLENVVKIPNIFSQASNDFKYLYVNEEKLEKVYYGTKLTDILGDVTGIKYFEVGTKFYDRSVLNKKIEELDTTNGVVKALDSTCCIIHESNKNVLEYRRKSCGKCLFCREGLIQLHTMVNEMAIGKGRISYLPLMKEIGEAMASSTKCSLGQRAAEHILSSIEVADKEYIEHIRKRKCLQGICISNENIFIDPMKCIGCEECVSTCPFGCIDGKPGYIHLLYDLDCTKCEKCLGKCKVGAIIKTNTKVPKLPDRLIKAGVFRY